jgi:hypothetical protein
VSTTRPKRYQPPPRTIFLGSSWIGIVEWSVTRGYPGRETLCPVRLRFSHNEGTNVWRDLGGYESSCLNQTAEWGRVTVQGLHGQRRYNPLLRVSPSPVVRTHFTGIEGEGAYAVLGLVLCLGDCFLASTSRGLEPESSMSSQLPRGVP